MEALIMAGGFGTRLSDITKGEIPKPMAIIAGKPIMEWAIICLKKYGVNNLYVSVSYLSEKIVEYFGDGSKFGVKINYIKEETPLGSGGALYYLKNKVSGDFIVCSGDTIFDINIKKMLAFHKKRKAKITLLTHPNNHPYDSDIILTDRNDRVKGILLKNTHEQEYCKNNVNAGFFIISSTTLDYFDTLKKVNMEHDFVLSVIKSGQKVCAYKSTEYIKDVGTPERFYKTQGEIENGLVSARNLQNKQKAIFLDRDGTINKYDGFINTPQKLELYDFSAQAIKKINQSGYLAIVVSNQPVIARGEATFGQVEEIFDKMETLLGKEGAFVDAIFYCPHHPHKGFKGEVKRLKKECDCRKPKIGMLIKAQKKFNLDLSKCYIVGDSDLDVLTGINAGIKTVRINSELNQESYVNSTYYANNLSQAVDLILSK